MKTVGFRISVATKLKGLLARIKLFLDFCSITLMRRIKVKGTNISYRLPKCFILSIFDCDRYQRTKFKEEDTYYWLSRLSKSGKGWNTFVDIGCNVGVFSLLVKKMFTLMDVFSFDPLFKNCLTTYKMLVKNSGDESLSVVQQAFLSNTINIEEKINMLAPSGSTIGTRKERCSEENSQAGNCLSIPISVFTLFGKQETGQKKTICKIDVDGPEFEILKGFSQEQFSTIGSLCVEIDLFEPEDAIEIDLLLKSKGLVPSSCNKTNLESYIQNISSRFRGRLENIKAHLPNNQSCFDDGLTIRMQETKFHEVRAKSFASTQNAMNSEKQKIQRLALNWFYYDIDTIELIEGLSACKS